MGDVVVAGVGKGVGDDGGSVKMSYVVNLWGCLFTENPRNMPRLGDKLVLSFAVVPNPCFGDEKFSRAFNKSSQKIKFKVKNGICRQTLTAFLQCY